MKSEGCRLYGLAADAAVVVVGSVDGMLDMQYLSADHKTPLQNSDWVIWLRVETARLMRLNCAIVRRPSLMDPRHRLTCATFCSACCGAAALAEPVAAGPVDLAFDCPAARCRRIPAAATAARAVSLRLHRLIP